VQAANYREAIDFAHLAKRHGAHNVRFSPLIHPDGEAYFRPFVASAIARCRLAEGLTGAGFTVFNQFTGRLSHMNRPEQKTCWHQQISPFIGGDQRLYRCCNTAYTQAGLLGDLTRQSFEQLWTSDAKLDAVESFDARNCHYCVFKDKNAAAARLVAEPTGHDCFA
jgi:hypothetical protein